MDHVVNHLWAVMDDLEGLQDVSAQPVPPVPTGIPSVDRLTGGLDGRPWFIKGDPGIGTTSMALQITRALLEARRDPIVYLTAELDPREVALRLVAGSSRIPLEALRAGRLEPRHWPLLASSISWLARTGLHVVDGRGCDAHTVATEIEQGLAGGGSQLRWMIVDSLDRVGGDPMGRLSGLALRCDAGLVTVARRPSFSPPPPASVVLDLAWDADIGLRLAVVRGGLGSRPSHAQGLIPIGIRPSDLRVFERWRTRCHPAQGCLF